MFSSRFETAEQTEVSGPVDAKLIRSYYSSLIQLFVFILLTVNACVWCRKIKTFRERFVSWAKKQNGRFISVNCFGPAN